MQVLDDFHQPTSASQATLNLPEQQVHTSRSERYTRHNTGAGNAVYPTYTKLLVLPGVQPRRQLPLMRQRLHAHAGPLVAWALYYTPSLQVQ